MQGFIKRLELDGAGKPTGTKDFVSGWFGVDIELWNGELYYVNFGDGGRGSGSVVRICLFAQQQHADRGGDRHAHIWPRRR